MPDDSSAAAGGRARLEASCERCGARFPTTGWRKRQGWGRYCSRACKYAALRKPNPSHFWDRVDASAGTDACWPWTGAKRYRYGSLWHDGRQWRAHRLAYTLTKGAITPDVVIRHSCDNPPCCNPAHLLAGTHADNVADRHARGRDARGDRSGARTKPHRLARGERAGGARLTWAQVRELRARYATGCESYATLARAYAVDKQTVANIVRGERWRPEAGAPADELAVLAACRALVAQRTAARFSATEAERIRGQHQAGAAVAALAREYGADPETVRRLLSAGARPEPRGRRKESAA